MLLKRIYNHKAPKEKWLTTKVTCPTCKGKDVVVSADATSIAKCPDCRNGVAVRVTPPVDHVQVKHTGTKVNQNFSTRFVETGILEGWVSMVGQTITLHTKPQNLVYAITKRPGRYCSHCGDKLNDDTRGVEARAHVREKHPGKKSPDPESPAGYAQVNAYLCTLDGVSHAKFKAGGRR